MNKKIKVLYGLLMLVFWMTDASVSTFTSAFLLGEGFSNTAIGLVLGASGVIALFNQPLVANMLDQSEKYNVMEICAFQFIFSTITLILLFTVKTSILVTAILFTIAHTIILSSIPLIHSIFFVAKRFNPKMRFGIYRAFGCIGFSLSSFVCGRLINAFGGGVVPLAGAIISVVTIVLLLIINYYYRNSGVIVKRDTKKEPNVSFKDFILNNKVFVLCNIAIAMFCVTNKIMSSYILQIIKPLGGTTADQGNMSTMWSFLEMLPMFFIDKISKHVTLRTLIVIAGFGNAIKMFGFWAASSLSGIYLALVFQMFSQGLFNPCIVPFLDSRVSEKEKVRAQSLHTMLLSADTIILSGVGGIIIDNFGIKTLTFISFIVVLLGAILFTILSKKKNTAKLST